MSSPSEASGEAAPEQAPIRPLTWVDWLAAGGRNSSLAFAIYALLAIQLVVSDSSWLSVLGLSVAAFSHFLLGQHLPSLLLNQGHHARALAVIRYNLTPLALPEPTWRSLHLLEIRALLGLGREREALARLPLAARLGTTDRADLVRRLLLSEVLIGSGLAAEAQRLLEAPPPPESWPPAQRARRTLVLSAALSHQDRVHEAAALLAELDPADLEQRSLRAIYAHNRGKAALMIGSDPRQALAWLQQAASLYPGSPLEILETLGAARIACGQPSAGLEALERLPYEAQLPARRRSWRALNRGLGYEAMGLLDEAAREYRQALAAGGPGLHARRANQQLMALRARQAEAEPPLAAAETAPPAAAETESLAAAETEPPAAWAERSATAGEPSDDAS